MAKLILPFEEVYCINLVERPDRLELQKKQYEYLGITDKVEIYQDVIHPFCNEISKFMCQSKLGGIVGNAFSCTRNHYRLIKSAYLRGVESILIIEDDNCFYKDIETLQYYLDNLPEDWEILRLNSLRSVIEEIHFRFNEHKDKLWDKSFSNIFGTGCYALNRQGMEYMIGWIETQYDSIDTPIHNFKHIKCNTYIPNLPLGLCLTGKDNDSNISYGSYDGGPQYDYLTIQNIDLEMYKY